MKMGNFKNCLHGIVNSIRVDNFFQQMQFLHGCWYVIEKYCCTNLNKLNYQLAKT